MKKTEFDRYVSKLSEKAENNPKQFDRSLWALALTCYGYLIVLLLLALGTMAVSALALFLSWETHIYWATPLLICSLLLVLALWGAISFPQSEPDGLILDKSYTARLRNDIRDLTRRAGSPRVDEITSRQT